MSKRDRESVFQVQVGRNSVRNWNFDLVPKIRLESRENGKVLTNEEETDVEKCALLNK